MDKNIELKVKKIIEHKKIHEYLKAVESKEQQDKQNASKGLDTFTANGNNSSGASGSMNE